MKEKKHIDEKIVILFIVFTIIISIFSILYAAKILFFPSQHKNTGKGAVSDDIMGSSISRMSFTSFDIRLAKKFMDKDNDGQCDICGMPVDMCISSGQLQCNMGPSSTIGVLGTQHIHADWKIYINGDALDENVLKSLSMDMSKVDNSDTSSFIHLDNSASATEKTGDIIHMHASGVPLWIFFESVGMKFDKECLTLNANEKYCNNKEKLLKFYVNGEKNNEFGDYVFRDKDKLLISYGSENNDAIGLQIDSITDFSENH